MKIHFSKFAALSILITAGHLQAADLTVRGVITPPACTVNFTNGGDLDWGDIPHSSLSQTQFTVLPPKEATLQVSCENNLKTHIAFWATDANRTSAAIGVPVEPNTLNGQDPARIFGIGFDPVTNNMIGNFTMIGKRSTYDTMQNSEKFGFVMDATHSLGTFASWTFASKAGLSVLEDRTILDAADKPASATNFSYTFDVIPQINRSTLITNAQSVPFLGTATFYVRYF